MSAPDNDDAVRFTKQQIEVLWIEAGGDPKLADVASAVALGESGGDPNVVHENRDKDGVLLSTDRGLFQINDAVETDHNGNLWLWFDAFFNTIRAVQMYYRGGFERWRAYTNGHYKQFLSKP